jgi:hypothetical protein
MQSKCLGDFNHHSRYPGGVPADDRNLPAAGVPLAMCGDGVIKAELEMRSPGGGQQLRYFFRLFT